MAADIHAIAEPSITWGQLGAITSILIALLSALQGIGALIVKLIVDKSVATLKVDLSNEYVKKETCHAIRLDCGRVQQALHPNSSIGAKEDR